MNQNHDFGRERILTHLQTKFPKVRHIIDAKHDLEIDVSPKDVVTSLRKEHNHCAMATACEHLVGVDGAMISLSRAYVVKGTTATRYMLPATVARELTSFDRAGVFAPGRYLLKAVNASQILGVKASPAGHTSKPKKKRRRQHITAGIRASLR